MEDKNAIYQMRFPQKLWYLLNLRPDAILWGGTGRTILLNYRILQSYLECDHSVFKTTNISSFVRQLNLYGFRKVTSHLQDPLCNSSNPYMHEYVHDYFQFGRPELLNKITRKALTMKRSFKPKNNIEQLHCLTPLQKARHALRMALKKAAQELYSQDSFKHHNPQLDFDDSQEDVCEEEKSFELNWSTEQNDNIPTMSTPEPAILPEPMTKIGDIQRKEVEQTTLQEIKKEDDTFEIYYYTYHTVRNKDGKQKCLICTPSMAKGQIVCPPIYPLKEEIKEIKQDSLLGYPNYSCPEHNDSFPTPFLSMPDLDPVATDLQTGAELLAEFNIDNDIDEGITRKIRNDSEHGSLNCVLPSINQDQNDHSEAHVPMEHYNGDWDQMFNDMMNRSTNQEYGSELKDLYSQISKTIDLLNS